MKKKINILLLLCVLGLWGTVIYKYVSQYFIKNDQGYEYNNSKLSTQKLKIKEKDTFELKPISRDPFLNKSYQVKREVIHFKRPPTIIKNKVQKQVVNKPFPHVDYFGYIKSEKGDELVLIKIDGKFFKIKKNELKDGLKVNKIFKDSIQISYDGILKTIKK